MVAFLEVVALPLANAGTASIGEDDSTGFLKGIEGIFLFKGGADLFGSGGDQEFGLWLETRGASLLDKGLAALHVLVGGVGAGADETGVELGRPIVGFDCGLKEGDWSRQVGGEWTVKVRLQGGEINGDDLVVLGVGIGLQIVVLYGSGLLGDRAALGGIEVTSHRFGEWEEGSSGTNLTANR